jgi:LDH2 family malate/lactate/ureidoglycolate dehydrogenase
MEYIPIKDLIELGTNLLVSRGVPKKNAKRASESAVLNEAAGVTTHGVSQFFYFDENVGTKINPTSEPYIVTQKAGITLIDGNSALAQLAIDLASKTVIKTTKKYGISTVSVRNISWVAGLGVKLIPIVEKGFFAEFWAGSSFKYVAPFGGMEAMMGTNPIGFAFPVPGSPPVIVDISTSVIARGKIPLLLKTKSRTPEKIFLDSQGKTTDDPSKLGSKGSLLPLGGEHYGYKGFGLSLWVEALALMSGNLYEPERVTGESFTITLTDPTFFGEMESYTREITQLIKMMKDSKKRYGSKEIRIPGERTFSSLAESKKRGVPLPKETLSKLEKMAEKNGLKPLKRR